MPGLVPRCPVHLLLEYVHALIRICSQRVSESSDRLEIGSNAMMDKKSFSRSSFNWSPSVFAELVIEPWSDERVRGLCAPSAHRYALCVQHFRREVAAGYRNGDGDHATRRSRGASSSPLTFEPIAAVSRDHNWDANQVRDGRPTLSPRSDAHRRKWRALPRICSPKAQSPTILICRRFRTGP